MPLKVSLWWDRPASKTMKGLAEDLNLIKEMGLSRVIVQINDIKDKSFNMGWFQYDDLKVFAAALKNIGVGLDIMSWVKPRPTHINGLLEELPQIAIELGAGIEFDLEGNWQEDDVQEYKNLDATTKDLLQGLALFRDMSGKISITSHTGYIPERMLVGFPADLVSGVDEVALQCYSHWNPAKQSGPNYSWSGIYGPGNLQKLGLKKLSGLNFKGRQIIGLAVYKQKYPDHTELEAMQIALDMVRHEVPEVRYWSRQNLQPSGAKFIKEIPRD